MKYLVFFVVVVAINAEAQRPFLARFSPKFQRIEAPYPAAGFRPAQEFKLPDKQPLNTYGAPQEVYGPPEVTTENDAETTTEIVEPQPAELKNEENSERGVYYVYHPTGVLQKIVYATKNDLKNMAYTAQFKYQDVEPINDPIFTYDPDTLLLRQVVV